MEFFPFLKEEVNMLVNMLESACVLHIMNISTPCLFQSLLHKNKGCEAWKN